MRLWTLKSAAAVLVVVHELALAVEAADRGDLDLFELGEEDLVEAQLGRGQLPELAASAEPEPDEDSA